MMVGKFTFKRFYERRIKRILPIFYFVVFSVIAVGYFILSPAEYKSLNNSAIAANSFLANFRFMLTGNYFQEENMRPLLHLWSLAVEEQFYFIWPSLLLLLIKFNKARLPHILAVLILLSFVAAEIASRDVRLASMSYYMLPTRMGELLLGAILVFIALPNKKIVSEVCALIGLIFMFYAVFLVDSQTFFPGIYSFIPCVGCAMIIAAGPNTVMAKFLSIRPLVFIGLISYSLYLWHWPVIILYKSYFLIDILSHQIAILIASIIILFSWFTTEFIENRLRRSNISFRSTILTYLVIPMILLFVVSFFISHQNGMPERFGLNEKMSVTDTVACEYDELGYCYISNEGASSILLLGDSHAKQYSNFFKLFGTELDIKVIRSTSAGCAFEKSTFSSQACEKMKSKVEVLAQKVDKIVIVKRIENLFQYEKGFNDYIAFIQRMTKYQKPIVVLAQVPKNYNTRFIDVYIKSKSSNTPELIDTKTDPLVAVANAALQNKISIMQNVEFISFHHTFCENSYCRHFDENNVPIYFDDDHISAYGSEWLATKVLHDDKYLLFIEWLKK